MKRFGATVTFAALTTVLAAGCGSELDQAEPDTAATGGGGQGQGGGEAGGLVGTGGSTDTTTTDWVLQFGDEARQEPHDLALVGTQFVAIAGQDEGSIDLGGGPLAPELAPSDGSEGFVGLFSRDGEHVWSHRLAMDDHSAMFFRMDANPNSVLLAGYFDGDFHFDAAHLTSQGGSDLFVAKMDVNGALDWARSFGGAGHERLWDVATDPSGNSVIVGLYKNGIQLDDTQLGGGTSGFLAKLSPQGTVLWGRTVDSARLATDVAIDGSGNIIEVGLFKDSPCGNLTAAEGQVDIYVAKHNPEGATLWCQRIGGPGYANKRPVTVDSEGNIILAGYYYGGGLTAGDITLPAADNAASFLLKLRPDGQLAWLEAIGQAGVYHSANVTVGPGGDIVLSGAELVDNQALAFLTRFSAAGEQLWKWHFQDYEKANLPVVAMDGELLFAAGMLSSGSADLGTGPLTTASLGDVLLARFTLGAPPIK